MLIDTINNLNSPEALVGLEATDLPPQSVGNAVSLNPCLGFGEVEPVRLLYT